jgi:hypothetical protein
MDQYDVFLENIKNPEKKQKLSDLGFLDINRISYNYNRLGFRAEEFDNRPSGIALGCSFTQGIGLPLEDSWPSQLSKLLGQHIWNLGVRGSSADTAYNLIEHYIDKLNPTFVVMCVPPKDRFEFFRGHDPVRIMGSNFESLPLYNPLYNPLYKTFFMEWFSSEENSKTNQRKNIRAIQQLCLQHGLPFYYLLAESDLILDQNARDLSHPGAESNRDFAIKMYNLMDQPI